MIICVGVCVCVVVVIPVPPVEERLAAAMTGTDVTEG